MPTARCPYVAAWTLTSTPLLTTYLAYHLPFYQELYQRRLVVLAARAGVDVMPELLA
jgi:hypothetical protein